ncbi:MAG: tRNA uridine(34) 5-carboxymethylaminomethyl modification radical SAM/GNAT enzyme Elp3 [Nanoarchaeota archaeon]|nr:MAG: tRNA uridine(34) 5-carboxymethylaminomethyl modification radical SAM/GNAT enzyme Elp3 [Nanoarchaeota archaeon]
MSSDGERIIQRAILRGAKTQEDLNRVKIEIAREFGLKRVPTNIELAAESNSQLFSVKPTRISSGVNVIAVMTKPIPCPHGKCTYCPGGPGSVFGDVPQSYTGNEPATMRAIRNSFDGYFQVMSRLEQYGAMKKLRGKIELIIMGGTFPSFEESYQEEFTRDAFTAMNVFSREFYEGNFNTSKFNSVFELPGDIRDPLRTSRIKQRLSDMKKSASLEDSQEENESSNIRCVALCIETKPDWSMEPHIDKMLSLGATRVELGIQSLSNEVLKKTNRGHSVEDSIESTRLLKDSFLKVGYHMMPGQPGSTKENDEKMLKELFDNPDFQPDALKIYPCMVMPGTPLYEQWKRGQFKPINTDEAAEIIASVKPFVPPYCRIMRIQRDIPTKVTADGVDKTNLRQIVEEKMKASGKKCRCIRCREPRWNKVESVKLNRIDYNASGGREIFLSFDDMKNDFVLGYLRLRIPNKPFRPEITENSAGVRELHVFGESAAIGEEGKIQHHGLGTKLMHEAEKIAKEEFGCQKMLVISGVGAREYYRKKHNYISDGPYMSKML